jgi:hypothetical protein
MSMVGSQSAQAQTQLRIDTVQWDPDDKTQCILLLRNTGSTTATIESVSIRENKAGSVIYTVKLTAPVSIDVSDTLNYIFEPGMSWSNSQSYVIKVTATTGFFYELVATTPAAPVVPP